MPSPSEVGSGFSSSSLGPNHTTFGPTTFRGTSVLSSPRYRELDRRAAYYHCRQHDEKGYDWDGRILSLAGPGALASQPLISKAVAPYYVPLSSRRPSAPYRLARVVTNAFTNMIFGAQRFPDFKTPGDEDTQDFDEALVKAANLRTKMIRARRIGGSCGTVGLSWCYDYKGRPRVSTHEGKYLYVHEWDDREELVPAWVTEVYLTPKDEWDGQRRKYVRNWYWRRRDWTEGEDIVFVPQLYQANKEPIWQPDATQSVTHDDGFCHFVWIQNLPSEEIDGECDYDGLYEFFDQLDVMLSVISKGAVLNLDPTLVLKVDRDIVGTMGVAKGSDNSLVVGEEGGAEYLELLGSSIEAGVKLFNEKRRAALEVAQCVVPDPSENSAADTSSLTLKTRYMPMLGKCEVLREQYGGGMKRLLEQMTEVARLKGGKPRTIYEKDEEGNITEKSVVLYVTLPPKVVEQEAHDAETGEAVTDPASGEKQTRTQFEPRQPGPGGGELEVVWPEYFPPTPADKQQAATALTTANGGKPVISQQTSVEQAASMFGVSPDEEWERVQKDGANDDAKLAAQAKAFGENGDGDGAGGKVPPGGTPKPNPTPKPKFGGSSAPFGDGDKPDGSDGGDVA